MCLCQYFLFNPSGQRTAWIQLWYCTTWAGAKVISVGMWLNQLPFIILTWSDMCSVAMLKAFAEFEYRWSVACQFLGHLNDLNNRPDLASLDPTETLRLLILILALKDLTQFKTTRVRLKRIPSQQESWTAAVGQIPHWYTSCIFMPSIFLLHVPRNSLFRKDRFHTSQHPRLRQSVTQPSRTRNGPYTSAMRQFGSHQTCTERHENKRIFWKWIHFFSRDPISKKYPVQKNNPFLLVCLFWGITCYLRITLFEGSDGHLSRPPRGSVVDHNQTTCQRHALPRFDQTWPVHPLRFRWVFFAFFAFHVFFGGEDEDEVRMQAKDLETHQIWKMQ